MQKADYIYIASRGRSGSTLLERLLGGHPEITSIGEIEKLSLQFARGDNAKYPGLCSCGKRPLECGQWKAVAEQIKQNYGVDMSKTPFKFKLSDIGWEEDYGIKAPSDWFFHKITRLYRNILYSTLGPDGLTKVLPGPHKSWVKNRQFVADKIRELTKTVGIVDASKDQLAMRDLYDLGDGKTKILFLTRSVYAVTWSSIKGRKAIDDKIICSESKKWLQVNKSILRFLAKIPKSDWIHIRYEDLCANPQQAMRNICDFLGYKYDDAILSPDLQECHTIGGNSMRYEKIEKINEDLSWQKNLSTGQGNLISAVAGELMEELGYSN